MVWSVVYLKSSDCLKVQLLNMNAHIQYLCGCVCTYVCVSPIVKIFGVKTLTDLAVDG